MMHASRLGIDSHGVRLAAHYAKVLQTGRVNPHPNMQVKRTGPATAILDADDGLGHRAAYAAMDLAAEIAREMGAARGRGGALLSLWRGWSLCPGRGRSRARCSLLHQCGCGRR